MHVRNLPQRDFLPISITSDYIADRSTHILVHSVSPHFILLLPYLHTGGMHARHKGRFIKRAEKLRREKCADIVRDLWENDRVDEVHKENNADIDNAISKGVTSCDSNDAIQWNEGRRVVELGVLANGLRACQEFGEELSLSGTECETREGLASILYVRCKCGMINSVYTSKLHRTEGRTRGKPVYDVNTKAAMGELSHKIILIMS